MTDWQAEIDTLRAELAAARALLGDCRHKLQLYRDQHSGEYIGGREFHGLMRDVDAAIATHKAAG